MENICTKMLTILEIELEAETILEANVVIYFIRQSLQMH